MKIPLSYIVRNLWTRKLTTTLTAGGMALVVFVFATVLMLEEGLRETLVQTGSWDNAVVIRRSSGTEVQSVIDRNQAAVIASAPEVAYGADGEPMASKEVVVLINLEKRGSAKPSNVVIRGVGAKGLALRPQLKLTEGRMFRPGSSEIVAGRAIAQRFSGAGLNETLRFGGREWTVVGLFDAGGSGFDSEIWGDADQMMQAFRRNAYSVTVVKLVAADRFPAFRARLEADPRLTVEAKRETVFYAEQSELLANFIRILGPDAVGDFFVRRHHRRHDHDVRRGVEPDRRDRHAARAGLSTAQHPGGVPARIAVPVPARRGDRALPRFVHATRERVDHELAVLRGDRLPLFAHAAHRPPVACVRSLHGIARRRAAGLAGGTAQDRGRAAGGVGCSGSGCPRIFRATSSLDFSDSRLHPQLASVVCNALTQFVPGARYQRSRKG